MAKNGKWKKLGDGNLFGEEIDRGLGHIVPVKVYNRILISLLLLTVVTVYIATFDFGVFNFPLAMAVATFKVSLVAMFFMHLKWESKMVWVLALYPLGMLGFFMLGTWGDVAILDNPTPAISEVQLEETHTKHDGHDH